MKIYTKTGDKGQTSLFGGKRLDKDDIRIEAYGTVDELNSNIGFLNACFEDSVQNSLLVEIQKRLFTVGSNLASDPDKEMITPDLKEEDIQKLELAMDEMNHVLPGLRFFILPGGDQAVGSAHICRTVCRRAERRVITLSRMSEVDDKIIIYLNRLSDYLFVLARKIGFDRQIAEIPWEPRKNT
ncbi:MAG: cob(I)yrinic acid a,c-diamide adenosyltransferase [Saprospiraceae bacterium]|nr:cob(I)yrinic acid a,c-diamide adenosyltransferase [Saprospiraceae bacterium]